MGLSEVLAKNAAENRSEWTFAPGAAPAPPRLPTGSPLFGRVALPVAECRHGGTDRDIIEIVPGCTTGARHKRRCAKWQIVTRETTGGAYMSCAKCRKEGLGYEPVAPTWTGGVLRYDEYSLYPGLKGKRFNPGLLEWQGAYAFVWRDGWAGSDLWACRMDRRFRPVGPAVRLDLRHADANYGREDPQLFIHRGALHVAFVGVLGNRGRVTKTSVLYARLGAGFSVEAVFAPKPPGVDRRQWQKNWQFFDHAGTLYAVYSIAPHKILRLDEDRAEWAHDTMCPFLWPGGELRGGASPVLVGDEYFSFFHDKVPGAGKLFYRVGLYTFDAHPPFRVRRAVPHPVLAADPRTNVGPDANYCDCVFPRGAVRDGSDWVLSCGIHDRWTELHRLPHADLERRLARFSPPPEFDMPDTDDARGIYANVVGLDEYRLGELRLAGAAVLDVGAHVGTFALAAVSRGAAVVHSYEPYPYSFDYLARNARHMPPVRAFNEAVGAGAGRGRFPDRAFAERVGGWTVLPEDGGELPVIGLDEAITRLASVSPSGRVELLKIDAEGAEWLAFSHAKRLDLVDAIVGEWHRYEWDGRKWGPDDLAGLLSPHGFDVTYTPAAGWGGFRATRRVPLEKHP